MMRFSRRPYTGPYGHERQHSWRAVLIVSVAHLAAGPAGWAIGNGGGAASVVPHRDRGRSFSGSRLGDTGQSRRQDRARMAAHDAGCGNGCRGVGRTGSVKPRPV